MLEREEAVKLAKEVRGRLIVAQSTKELRDQEYDSDVVALCEHILNRNAELSYALRAQADRVYSLAEAIKRAGDAPWTPVDASQMPSLGYELAEMILAIEPDFKIDGPYYNRTDSLQFEEMQLIEPDNDEAQIVANLKLNIDRVLAGVLAGLEQPVMVKQAMTAVKLDHNHIQWKPGVVVERVEHWDENHKHTGSFIRVAASFHVEGYRVVDYPEGDDGVAFQRLVKIDG